MKKKLVTMFGLLCAIIFVTATVSGEAWTTNQVRGTTRTRGAYASGPHVNEAYAKVGNAYQHRRQRGSVYSQAMGNAKSSHTAWTRHTNGL